MLTDNLRAMINNLFKESFYEKRKKKYIYIYIYIFFDNFFQFLVKVMSKVF